MFSFRPNNHLPYCMSDLPCHPMDAFIAFARKPVIMVYEARLPWPPLFLRSSERQDLQTTGCSKNGKDVRNLRSFQKRWQAQAEELWHLFLIHRLSHLPSSNVGLWGGPKKNFAPKSHSSQLSEDMRQVKAGILDYPTALHPFAARIAVCLRVLFFLKRFFNRAKLS